MRLLRALLAILLAIPSLLAFREPQAAPRERVPWTSSRVTGSPDPPPPFRTVRAFPDLKFERPTDLTLGPGGDRLFVVEQSGRILSFPAREPAAKADLFIDLKKDLQGLDKIPDCRGVSEAYALAFHPAFAKNRTCYVMYVLGHKTDGKNLPNGSRISRFTVTDAVPPRCDPASEKVLVEWIAGGHNGCALKFGRDGFLYISTGDGTSPNPPDAYHTGQDCSDLLSSILRIDVDRADPGLAYAIPKDNPFVGMKGVRPEIWAYGFRNPWRMNFDRATGDLWVGDVGWEKWELVHRVERGGNYGWSIMEGPQPVNVKDAPGPTPIRSPLHAIPHPEGASITGGFVYRGKKFPELAGSYVYGDWETRRFWANAWDGTALGERRTIAVGDERVVAFEEDADGELLILDYEKGGIHRFERNDAKAATAAFPRTLGETGLFTSVAEQTPAPGVLPYEINAPMWMDGATARRFLAVPGTAKAGRERAWVKDTVLAKTISVGGRRVETQLLHFDGRRWNAYAYLWNDAQTDAELVDAQGRTKELPGRAPPWTVASRAACLTCHNSWPGVALSLDPLQLDRRRETANGKEDQLRLLRELGLIPPDSEARGGPLVDPADASAGLEARARSYLHANCAHCHRFGGGGAALIDLRRNATPKEFNAINVRPALGTFELASPYIVCGGDPARSALYYRMAKLGRGRMPHIGSELVDLEGLELLARWIDTLPPPPDPAAPPSATSDALRRLRRGDVAGEELRQGLTHANPLVRDLYEHLAPPVPGRRRLGTGANAEEILALRGDFERGRALVFESTLQCRACHRFGTGDEKMGPELGEIGKKYPRAKLLETILDPSKEIDPKFVSWLVETNSGAIHSGLLVESTAERIVLRDAEKTTPIPAASVKRKAAQQKSIMPDFLLQDLTAQEAADLLEFLQGLK